MYNHLPVRKSSNQEGVSLLEILVAIAIVVVSLTALVAIANTATRNVATSRNHTIADQHVRAGIERVRNIRDNARWQGLLTANGTSPTLGAGQSRYYSLNASGAMTAQTFLPSITQPCTQSEIQTTTYSIENGYYRIVKMSLNSTSDEVRVIVTVCFNYRGGTNQKVSAETVLTNWR